MFIKPPIFNIPQSSSQKISDLEKVIKQAKNKYGSTHELKSFIYSDEVRGIECSRCDIDFILYPEAKIKKTECFGWKNKLYDDIARIAEL